MSVAASQQLGMTPKLAALATVRAAVPHALRFTAAICRGGLAGLRIRNAERLHIRFQMAFCLALIRPRTAAPMRSNRPAQSLGLSCRKRLMVGYQGLSV